MEESQKLRRARRPRLPKSRTGCRTCRIRHLKCDETPGSCRRCTTAGFKCDGYDVETLSHKRSLHLCATMALTEYRFRALLPDKSAEERRFFNYFYSFTIPMMSGWLDHRMWNCLALQMCQSEPAICHAVVALGALQEVSETTGAPVIAEDMSNRTQRFALAQYTRSIGYLVSRMRSGSNDPHVRSTVLLCCLLFIAFELIRGNFDRAVTHLRNGLRVLGTQKLNYHALYQTHPAFEQDIDQSLAAAMVHLDLQSAHFGISETHTPLDIATLSGGQGALLGSGNMDFNCIQDACLARDRTLHQIVTFVNFCETLSAASVAANYSVLLKEQQKHQVQLASFAQGLRQLEQKMLDLSSLTSKDLRSLEVLRMHHKGVSLIIDVCLIKNPDTIRDSYSERFSEVVKLAEQISAGVQEKAREAGPRPTLMMETAVIGPLYYIIRKCRNTDIAQRALRVLEEWPHREGMWDSVQAVKMAKEAMGVRKGNGA
ncbi:hypothetical protein BDW66DRAFT_165936 [Aspergillus desertorum]